jgi:hypothetical protein
VAKERRTLASASGLLLQSVDQLRRLGLGQICLDVFPGLPGYRPAGQPAHHQHHVSGQAGQSPECRQVIWPTCSGNLTSRARSADHNQPSQLIAQVTWHICRARPSTTARDQSISPRLPSSSRAPINQRAPADASTPPPRPAIMASSPPGLGLRGDDRLGGLILEYAQATSYG